jgi:outer membrane receptor protein involved in Fe transport
MQTLYFNRYTRFLSLVILLLGVGTEGVVYAQNEDALEEITVTGSRIVRRDFTSLSPIVTVDTETFENRANIGIESALNQLPQYTVAGTQAQNSTAASPFPAADAAPGAATLNLRGLGLNRNLILVDGRRVQPSNLLLVVDLDTIPAAAIERVEVITGGAAAVYGADAIAGVTNFILKKNFEGMEVSGQYGISQEGDGEEMQFSGLIGTDFADGRGNVMLGANYSDRDIIFSRDRDWVVDGWLDPGTQAGGIGSSNLTQYTAARASYCSVTKTATLPNCGQPLTPNAPTLFTLPPGRNYVIDQNGNLFDALDPMNTTRPYTGPLGGLSGFKINPDGSLGYFDPAHSYLQIPGERYAIFGKAHFALTDHINMFADVRYSETFDKASGFVSSLFNVWSPTVPYDPANDDPDSPTFGQGANDHPVPRAFADLLNSRPVPNAPWTYIGGLDYIPNFTTETTGNVFQVIGGLNGDITGLFDKEWSWEVYASHGKSTANARQPEGFPYLPRIQNVFNANQYGENFDISSLPGFFPLAVTGHCTSGLPIFNADGSVDNTPSISKDCADYIVLRMNNITTVTQEVVEGTIQGGLYDLPAGELRFALGADYRTENAQFDPDTGFNANQDFPFVIQNIILPVSVDGTTEVKEVYAELAIPIVRDLPFVKSFEVDPGVRWSDYNTTGGTETYKILGDWAVNDWIRFRGGFQAATRSPNVAELFTPRGGSQIQGVGGTPTPDPCANIPNITPAWGNVPGNPNRENVQILCDYLMERDGAPGDVVGDFFDPSLPSGTPNSADDYRYNVFGATFAFPFTIAVTEGNPNLEVETADTWTAGVILKSPFAHPLLDRLTVSLDYFIIDVLNAIGTPNHNSVYQQCLDAQYNSLVGGAPAPGTGAAMAANNPFCALIEREWTPGLGWGASRRFKARTINQGGIKSEGIDMQLDWGAELADMGITFIPGTFSVNVLATYLDLYAVSPFPGAAYVDYTGTTFNSSFDYRILSSFSWSNGPYYVGLRWQHLPSQELPPGSPATSFGVDSHDQVDLFGRWSFLDHYQLRVGIDNLLNADPEIVGANATNNARGATTSNYDQIGRRFFIGLTATF